MEDFFPQDRHIFVIYSKKCNKIVLLFCRPSICFCIHTPREAPWHCSQFLSGLKLKELFSRIEGSAYSRGTQRGYSSKPLNIVLLNVF